ncbi:mechanosensitive ion channel protein MscS [Saccharobesus litoralis]|uniref:Small-conductance mechanosensitive channel n=1 Tax=Saccharobesus litoralis TaxID=2172099 RepID=A0A2S0VX11_9ALTE|nr:mechanosensitive ion channel family protein [Saccharobesus litoralis]AWB68725.1 mechanosensitive ion channel protein MscS [Saccharobesus litoralis]
MQPTSTTQSQTPSLAPSELLQDEIDQVNKVYEIIIEFFTNYSFQLIGAIIIFFVGYYIAGKVSRFVLKLCEGQRLDVTLSRFLANTAKMLLVAMVLVVALGKLGISVTPFIAAIGAVSLGAGLALQGLLANYAAGFNIILIRPFVVGDTITVQGVTGIVKEVLLAYTILVDEDEVEITIPNKHIVGEVIHNSKHDSLLELSVGIAYQHNPIEVVKLIESAISPLSICSQARQPQVGIASFGDSSINLEIRLWTPTISLYAAKFEAYEVIYQTLEKHNIRIPFPQREVKLVNSQ